MVVKKYEYPVDRVLWENFPGEGHDNIIVYILDHQPPIPIQYSVLSKEPSKECLFSWDEVPGNDSMTLIEFLKQEFGISWVETAKIEKIATGRSIRIIAEKNYLSLGLNNEKTLVNLKIDDGRSAEFTAKGENGKLNIYSKDIDYGDYCKLNLKVKLKCPMPECANFEQIESFRIGLNKEDFENWKFGEKIIEFKCPGKHKYAFNTNLNLAYEIHDIILSPEEEALLKGD